MISFSATLLPPSLKGFSAHFFAPQHVSEFFGTQGRIAVRGTIRGLPFRNSLRPFGDGRHYMTVNKRMCLAANLSVYDEIEIELEADTEQRIAIVPEDIDAAVNEFPELIEFFSKLAYSYKKEIILWIDDARQPETRQRRIAKFISRLFEMKQMREAKSRKKINQTIAKPL